MFDPIQAIIEFIKFPSISTDSRSKAGMDGARHYVCGLLESMGLDVEVIDTPLHPIVWARREGPKDWPHIIVYGHYDVQPADPLELWESPPFAPEIRGGRLYGRGAADNKGPMMVHLAGAARFLKAHPDAPIRMSFLIEGEEEIGSPSFVDVLERHADRLRGDLVLLSDTLSPSTSQLAITTGLRGIVCLDVEIEGPSSDLHSGIFGGAVSNPVQVLMRLCASLHDDQGRVNIPGFYDAVVEPEPWEREELSKLGFDPASFAQQLGVPGLPKVGEFSPVEATRFQPTLEFNGIGGGYQGEGSKTIIPSRAMAKISCRLVANQDPATIEQALRKVLEERCPKTVRLKISRGHSGPPYRVIPPDRPNTPTAQNPVLAAAFREADAAIADHYGSPPLYLREGGSVPIIGDIQRILGMDSLMLGMFTPLDNLHAPNESADIEMLEKGMRVSERIFAAVAALGKTGG